MGYIRAKRDSASHFARMQLSHITRNISRKENVMYLYYGPQCNIYVDEVFVIL